MAYRILVPDSPLATVDDDFSATLIFENSPGSIDGFFLGVYHNRISGIAFTQDSPTIWSLHYMLI